MSKKSNYIKSIVALVSICLVVAALLGAVNLITAPKIAEADKHKFDEALTEVMPGDEGFVEIDLSAYQNIPESVSSVYRGSKLGGYVVSVSTKGYKPGLELMIGVSADGKVVGAKYLASNETNGAEKSYGERLIGATIDTIDAVQTVSGSTLTTQAYKNAAKDAIGTVLIIEGGNYDTRSEEEKRLDEALPSANGEFTRLVITEYLQGVTLVVSANNGTGYVIKMGDDYIAADAQGNTTASGVDAAEIKSFIQALASTELTPINLAEYSNMPSSVKSVDMTASGTYVLVVEGYGYSMQHKYGSKIPIVIRVAISASGKILDCVTLSSDESDGYGAKCEDSEYYTKYIGKDSINPQDPDFIISGATDTTEGYVAAVMRAYDAVEIIKGGSN